MTSETGAKSITRIIRWNDLEEYTPPLHSGTNNRRLLDTLTSGGQFSVVHGSIAQGGEAEDHYHSHSSQFVHILEGMCRLFCDGESFDLEPGDSAFIPVGVRHRVEVPNPGGVELINVYQPALEPEDFRR